LELSGITAVDEEGVRIVAIGQEDTASVLRLKGNNIKRQKVFSLVLLLSEVVFTLFIAGIVVPSLLRSDLATKETLAAGSLRTISIAGVAFSYTTENVEFAILGGLAGAMAAFAITFPPLRPRTQPQPSLCGQRPSDTETVLGPSSHALVFCRDSSKRGTGLLL
jgi:hypothetical protein